MNKLEAAQEILKRRQARNSLIAFIEYIWWKKDPFLRGEHTIEICAAIDNAINKYLNNESSYLDISVPFGHGKSDIVSRALPPYFLGRCVETEPSIILTGYGFGLIQGFSKDCKKIINSNEYKALFPNIKIAYGEDSVANWGIEDSSGRVSATGLGGSITGKRANLIVCDDYCKNIEEARSETFRNKTWDSFANDLMSRLANKHIVILCATPWHVDDIKGRLKAEELKNERFPKFQRLTFPAKKKLVDNVQNYLFEELFPKSWYEMQYAINGKLASGLLDCSPVLSGGNRFAVNKIKIHTDIKDFPNKTYIRAWDLASTSKERDKQNPDFTVGVLGTVTNEGEFKHLWIKDIVYGQWDAPQRNEKIIRTMKTDGDRVLAYVESFGAYKDTYLLLKQILMGIRRVLPSHLSGDKSAKCAPLEPVMEAGNVHILKADWNTELIKQFSEFPDGQHDDFPDACAIVFSENIKPRAAFAIR